MTAAYEGLVPCTHRTVDDGGRILCGLIKGADKEVSVNLCRACPVPQINCQHLRAGMQKRVSTPITVRFATGRVEVWDNEGPSIEFKQAACAVKTMPIHSPRDCTGCPLRLPHAVPQTANQIARRAKVAPSPQPTSAAYIAARPERGGVTQPTHAASQALDQSGYVDSAATQRMVRHARALASKNAHERGHGSSARPVVETAGTLAGEPVPKIILVQQWLAGQLNRKNGAEKQQAPLPDEDGVQEIVYSPVAPTYQEEPEYERCVGWTD